MGRLLTTGRVGQLCSVQPDTVLKWIKKGRLAATRTAGGHYRVDERDLLPLLPGSDREPSACPETVECTKTPLRCWEYMSDAMREGCKDCVVYRVRSSRCFELIQLVRGAGHSKCFAGDLCQDCPYYRRVNGLAMNVLVITQDESLIKSVASRSSPCASCRFARNGYDASAIISVFRPAVVVIGENVAASEPQLTGALAADPRASGARILLAPRQGGEAFRHVAGPIAGTIERPFCPDEIVAWTSRFPIEPATKETVATAPPKPASERTTPAPERSGGRRATRRLSIPA